MALSLPYFLYKSITCAIVKQSMATLVFLYKSITCAIVATHYR